MESPPAVRARWEVCRTPATVTLRPIRSTAPSVEIEPDAMIFSETNSSGCTGVRPSEETHLILLPAASMQALQNGRNFPQASHCTDPREIFSFLSTRINPRQKIIEACPKNT